MKCLNLKIRDKSSCKNKQKRIKKAVNRDYRITDFFNSKDNHSNCLANKYALHEKQKKNYFLVKINNVHSNSHSLQNNALSNNSIERVDNLFQIEQSDFEFDNGDIKISFSIQK